jgi:hypothetical protein
MTAAVALAVPSQIGSLGNMDISSTVTSYGDVAIKRPLENVLESSSSPATKKRKTERGKKPQMKYDPDIPMTKEEATVWRREQRRKRNRESAAASRQRQRDRIQELESEVSRLKEATESVYAEIRALEEGSATTPSGTAAPYPIKLEEEQIRVETPEPVNSVSSFCASPTTSTFLDFTGSEEKEVQQPKPIKMISRHA